MYRKRIARKRKEYRKHVFLVMVGVDAGTKNYKRTNKDTTILCGWKDRESAHTKIRCAKSGYAIWELLGIVLGTYPVC